MKKILAFCLRQHLFGNILTFAVIGVGIASLFWIRREVFPNVTFDIINVVTVFPGASPEEVEKLITNPLEQDLKEVNGIKRMQSVSRDGRSVITIFLDPDQTTGEKGKNDVQDIVDRFTDFPSSSKAPVVTSLESKQSPIIEISLSGNLSPIELRAVSRDFRTEIEKIKGIAKVVPLGDREKEIRVETDQSLLHRYRLSLEDIVQALRQQNVSIPAGTIEISTQDIHARERIVRTLGDFGNLEDVKNTVIRANDLGAPIKVGQVAKVFYELERPTLLTHTRGSPSVNLTVLLKEKADAISAIDRVKARVQELKTSLDPRVSVELINDFSEFIRRRLNILTSNLGLGLAMVLVLLPLLIPFRFSILIALGEPFAFLGTVLLLYLSGGSINLISMIGLIIVSGILVDDSIVVTENAVRLVDEGMDPKEAAVEGTLQIIPPVAASVASTAIAFMPMLFMSGVFGKFIKEIPFAVLTALGVSLFETFFILPAHIAYWIPSRQKTVDMRRKAKTGFLSLLLNKSRKVWDEWLVPVYIQWLKVSLRKRYWVAAAILLLFVGSSLLASKAMKFILFPPEGIEIFMIRADGPVGTSLDQMARFIKLIEKKIASFSPQELSSFTSTFGIQQQDPHDPHTVRGSHFAQVTVFLTPERDRTRNAAQIIQDLRSQLGTPLGLERILFERINPGPPTGKPVSLGVRAKTYEQILPAVAAIKEILSQIHGVTDIRDSYVLGKKEHQVSVIGSEAAAAGVSVASVGNTIRAAFEGLVATTVRSLDEEIDVRVSLDRRTRESEASIGKLLVPNPTGQLIPIRQVTKTTEKQSLSFFEHEANHRQIKITANVETEKISALEANQKLRKVLPDVARQFSGVSFAFGGEDEDTSESLESLMRAFGAAVLGIFMILVLTFRSLVQPLLILLTVPLGIIAVVWAFFIHGLPLSFMGCLGIIALAGVIVNNAIVLVDFVNIQRASGVEPMESIIIASKTRIRPIFLTTVTTVVGILPTAYGLGGLDMFVVPIAMALGWGLLFGSLLTAFVFPAALAILDDFSSPVVR